MNDLLKHPITAIVITLGISGAVAYFGFVQEATNTSSLLEVQVHSLRESHKIVKYDIKQLEVQIARYAGLPPRVDKLENVTQELQQQTQQILINQGIQGQELKNITEGVTELRYLLRPPR